MEKTLLNYVKIGLLTAVVCMLAVSGLQAAAPGGICDDYGCDSGESKCVTLPSGAVCWDHPVNQAPKGERQN